MGYDWKTAFLRYYVCIHITNVSILRMHNLVYNSLNPARPLIQISTKIILVLFTCCYKCLP